MTWTLSQSGTVADFARIAEQAFGHPHKPIECYYLKARDEAHAAHLRATWPGIRVRVQSDAS